MRNDQRELAEFLVDFMELFQTDDEIAVMLLSPNQIDRDTARLIMEYKREKNEQD